MARSKKLYCGPARMDYWRMLGRRCVDNPIVRFDDKDVYYLDKARVGIRLACEVMGIGDGDEILVPSYNCGSEVDALLAGGASVVPYRVDRSGKLDIGDMRRRVTEKTRAVFVIHYFGFPQAIGEVREFCDENGFYLIEDCVLALLSSVGDVDVGLAGDVAVFNFPKMLPVPNGGAMVINNPRLRVDGLCFRGPVLGRVLRENIAVLRRSALHALWAAGLLGLVGGMRRSVARVDTAVRDGSSLPAMCAGDCYDEQLDRRGISGVTLRMLRAFDVSEIVQRRRRNFACYLGLLGEVGLVKPLFDELPEGVCPMCFPVVVDNREEVFRELSGRFVIDAGCWWPGYHTGLAWEEYPDACFLKDNVLALPVHEQLDQEHVEFICAHFEDVVRRVNGSGNSFLAGDA